MLGRAWGLSERVRCAMNRNVSDAPILIRLLAPEDAESFREIRLEALRSDPEAFASTHDAEKDSHPAKYAAWLSGSQIFGAFRGTELVGIAALTILEAKKESHKGLLRSMYVKPQARKAGVGRQLIETMIASARGRIELLNLVVVSDNHPAIRLYESLGFKTYGLEKNSLKQDGKYFDELLMALDLTRI